MMKHLFSVFVLAPWLISSQLLAEPLLLQAGPAQSVLVELYTSEGCSSCPPAERYLNRFTEDEYLWSRYVPLAFHVDYWDDLGWKDRFAKAQYSRRQRHYATIKRQSTVYTPAFIINGDNWRPGFYNRNIDLPEARSGRLKLLIDEQQVQAQFDPLIKVSGNIRLNIALLGMGIESHIEAGENRGKQARHEFVVLSHHQYPAQSGHWVLPLPVYQDTMAAGEAITQFAIAAWVDSDEDPTPIQSVGGSLPSSWVRR